MRRLLQLIAFCILFTGGPGVCQGEVFFWKTEIFSGFFVTKDGRSRMVDEFTNVTEFHTFLYRQEGIICPLPVVSIKSLADLGNKQIQVIKKNGEIFRARTWNPSGKPCMAFSYFQAEATLYTHELQYTYYDVNKGKHRQATIPLCDVRKIVFD